VLTKTYSPRTPRLLERFRHTRPRWVDPAVFLDAQFQNMFEMSYWQDNVSSSSNSGPVTYLASSWNIVNGDKAFTKLSSRLPPPPPSDVEMQSQQEWAEGSDESGSEESTQVIPSNVTRMNEESSGDDDAELPSRKVCGTKGRGLPVC